MKTNREYDIGLSFAGEDRAFVDQVANILKKSGVKVFYDKFEQVDLWGKNLYEHLSEIYSKKCIYTVIFISKHYAEKLWTTHERKSAQARAFTDNKEYILPARFDDTDIPGILPTTGFIDLRAQIPESFAELIQEKIVASGYSIPRDVFRTLVPSSRQVPRIDPINASVRVLNSTGDPVSNVQITVVADNNTTKNAFTNKDGVALLSIPVRRHYKILAAHPDYSGIIISEWDPKNDIDIMVESFKNIGSLICNSTCYIPQFEGRLNPIRDSLNRNYLYADNISINNNSPQPVNFAVNVPMDLEDSNGVILKVRILCIYGKTALIEYVRMGDAITNTPIVSKRMARFLDEIDSSELKLIDDVASKMLFVENCDGDVTPFFNVDIYEGWHLGMKDEENILGFTSLDDADTLRDLGLIEFKNFEFWISVEGYLESDKIHISLTSIKRIFIEENAIVPRYNQPKFIRTLGPTVTDDGRPIINKWVKYIRFDSWKITKFGQGIFSYRRRNVDIEHFNDVRNILLKSGIVLHP